MGNSRATDGGDTASTEGGRVPRGDGELNLFSSKPGLVVEVGLIHILPPSAALMLLLFFPPRKPTLLILACEYDIQ